MILPASRANLSPVSVVKIKGQDTQNSIKQAIIDSMTLIEYQIPKNIRNIVIKPNMCYYWDFSTGQTTDPRFVAALIDSIRDNVSPEPSISVVESDASAMKCKHAFKVLGYEKMAQRYGVRLINLSKDKKEKVNVLVDGQAFSFLMPETIHNADLRINVPKIKYSMPAKFSCALKNIFGCNPYPNKFRYHPILDKVIVGLNKIMRFDFCILDGIIVAGTQPRKLNLIMASQDPVAFDAAAAEVAGLNPKSVKHIMLAHKERLGNMSFVSKGLDPDYFATRYPRMSGQYRILSLGYRFAVGLGLDKRLGLSD